MLRKALLIFASACIGSTASRCFQFPPGTDLAPLVQPVVYRGNEKLNNWVLDTTTSLAPLFDKSEAIDGTAVDFASNDEELKATFIVPETLPLVESVQLIGHGEITVTYETLAHETVSTVVTLDAENGHHASISIPSETRVLQIDLLGHGGGFTTPSLSDVQILSAAGTTSSGVDSDKDKFEDDKDTFEGAPNMGSEVDDESESDWSSSSGSWDSSSDEPVGCTCLGEPRPGANGSKCGEWDDDCKGAGGWCYVKPGACPDGKNSTRYGYLAWACSPCSGQSNSAGGGASGAVGGSEPVPNGGSETAPNGGFETAPNGGSEHGPTMGSDAGPGEGTSHSGGDGHVVVGEHAADNCICPPSSAVVDGTASSVGSSGVLTDGSDAVSAEKGVLLAGSPESSTAQTCGTCGLPIVVSIIGGLVSGALVMFVVLLKFRSKEKAPQRFQDILGADTP